MTELKKNLVNIEDIPAAAKSIDVDSRAVKGGVERSAQPGAQFFDEADALFGKVRDVKKAP